MTEKQEVTLDTAIAKCQRIQEVVCEIDDAWQDIINIFKQAARDCESEAQPTEQGGREVSYDN